MRPPILFITGGFGVGLAAGLDLFRETGEGRGETWVALLVVLAALGLARHAPLGAAIGVMSVAGMLWGGATTRERELTCAGGWKGDVTRAAIIRLLDPAPDSGGVVDADVVPGPCGGALRLRWPDGIPAAGGTTWVVAGRWVGSDDRGVLVVRRAKLLDAQARGRGAVRGRLALRSAALFGRRAPIVDALVFAPNAALDPDVRERYARSGLAHILSISGLHVGFLAAWLGLILRKLSLSPRHRAVASGLVLLGYLWLLGFPAPALRASAMLVVDDVARLRQRVAAPRGVIALSALAVLLVDPLALHSIGAWLSVSAIAAVIWGGRGTARRQLAVRGAPPAGGAPRPTPPIPAFSVGTVPPIGVLAHLIAIPLRAIVVPGLVFTFAVSWVLPGLASLLAAGSGLGLALLDLTAQGAAAVPGGHVIMVAGWEAAAVWLAVAVAGWWLWNSPRRPSLIAARVAFLTTVLVVTTFRDVVTLDECRCLTVSFLDVGQGDAAVLRTPNSRWVVIDGGPRIPGSDAGRLVVVPFLRRHGAQRLAVVVATHGDADHLGGLPAVVEALTPELVLEPGEPLGRPLYLDVLAAGEGAGGRRAPGRGGQRDAGGGAGLAV